MDPSYVPTISCRVKMRKDIDCHLAYFQGKGVLKFNELGALIVSLIDGRKNLIKIAEEIKFVYPEIKEPFNEVAEVVFQLRNAAYL